MPRWHEFPKKDKKESLHSKSKNNAEYTECAQTKLITTEQRKEREAFIASEPRQLQSKKDDIQQKQWDLLLCETATETSLHVQQIN